MASKYDDSNIPRWKKMKLTDEEIGRLQGKTKENPYNDYNKCVDQQKHKHRDISSEIAQIIRYMEKGLSISEVAKLINARVCDVEKCVKSNGYELLLDRLESYERPILERKLKALGIEID